MANLNDSDQSQYRDPEHIPSDNEIQQDIDHGSVDPKANKLADWIQHKQWGVDVRLALSLMVRWVSVAISNIRNSVKEAKAFKHLPQLTIDSYVALNAMKDPANTNDTVTIDSADVGFNLTKTSQEEYASVYIPAIVPASITATRPIYVNFDFSITGDVDYQKIGLWLADSHDMLHVVALTETAEKAGHVSYAIEEPLAKEWALNEDKYWQVAILLYAKQATLSITNFFVNYTGKHLDSVAEAKELDETINSVSQLPFANQNGLNSFVDYGLLKRYYVGRKEDELTVRSPYDITFKKRSDYDFNGFYAPIRMPFKIDHGNNLGIRAKFKITNDKNYQKTAMYLTQPDGTLFSTPIYTSTSKDDELFHLIEQDLEKAWHLNDVKFGVAILVFADEADLHVDYLIANNGMNVQKGYELANTTVASDNLISASDAGLSPFWNSPPSMWATDEDESTLEAPINCSSIEFSSSQATQQDKGFTIWLSSNVLRQFKDQFYLNGRAKVSSGRIDLNLLKSDGAYAGSVADEYVASQNYLKDFSVLCDTQKIIKMLGDDADSGRFGLLFATHEKAAISASLDHLTISAQPLMRDINNSIANVLLDNQDLARSYLGNEKLVGTNPISHKNLKYIGFDADIKGKQKLAKVKFNLSHDEEISLIAAKIDQNGLMVAPRTLKTYYALTGYNVLDLSQDNLILNEDEKLFFSVSANTTQYDRLPNASYPYLIVDDTHYVDQNQYTGYAAYNDGHLYPFYAEMVGYADSQVDLSEVNAKIDVIRKNYNPIIQRDDGTLQRLMQKSDNSLYWAKVIPNKIAIFGNSLTSATGGIGMAASDPQKDWYQLVVDKFKTFNKDVTVTPRSADSDYGWEQAETSQERNEIADKRILPNVSSDTGMVIYQLIDNINTPERVKTFEQDAESLIAKTKAIAPNATILWVAGWFVDDHKMGLVKQACDNQGAILVDITAFNSSPENKSKLGAIRKGLDGTTWTVTNPGEAIHPGDIGMKLIANAVLETLGLG